MNRIPFAILATFLVWVASGCETVNPRPDIDRVGQHVEQAIGAPANFPMADDSLVEERVTAILAGGLTADEAVQIAMMNNPRLKSSLYRLGIGRAELVQSGLLSNPSLTFALRWPDGGGLTNLQAGLAQNVAELWQIKHRTRAAGRDLDRAILDVAREASLLALDVRVAYWRAVRAGREKELAQENVALGQKLIDLTVSRRDAGAGSDVDVNLAHSQHIDSEFQVRSAALAAVEAQAGLGRLLGLVSPPGDVTLTDPLAEPASWALSSEAIIAAAKNHRLDVQAARMAVTGAADRVALEKTRFLRSLELGLSTERSARGRRSGRDWLAETAAASAQSGQLTLPSFEPREERSTDWVVGPEIGVELPIFDQNQAQIARAEYVHQQAVTMLDALERELAQDAHLAVERAQAASDNLGFYKDRALPLRERGLTLAQAAYTAGRTTLLAVQESQRSLLSARLGYVEALAQYALALVEVERVAGTPFSALLLVQPQNQPVIPNPVKSVAPQLGVEERP
jgi:cobalt-zinc-cadmium efflux system outer membrane protein